MIRYPDARWKGDGRSGGAYIDVPWRVVLHTTETRGVPGYSGGAAAPHLTYWAKWRKWVQHTDLGVAARALRNTRRAGETNRARAIQVEIVCYSNRPLAEQVAGIWVGDLTTDQLADIRLFLIWCKERFGIEWRWPNTVARSYAEANTPGFRMFPEEWFTFDGVCGHQHVPENTHWDPGLLNWSTLMAPLDPPEEDDMFCKHGDKGLIVNYWQRRLNRLGAGLPVNSEYTADMKAAVAALVPPQDGHDIGPIEADVIDWLLAEKAAGGSGLRRGDNVTLT